MDVHGWKGKRALVTGGLGFIGSNLVVRLAGLGAAVTIVDSAVEGCGANPYNVAPVAGQVRVIVADIGETAALRKAIRSSDVIFNLAGEVSHVHSMKYPARDAALNCWSHLRFLEACVELAPGIRIVYASTRQIYGIPDYLPVDERHPVRPVDFNGIHKHAATMYHLLWGASGVLDPVVLCLTNVYGPRLALNMPCQGFLGNFCRKLIAGERLEVFGDGRQLRDPLYVDDAVEAFLLAGSCDTPPHRTYNVGGAEVLPIGSIAETAAAAAGGQPAVFRPFPADRKIIDIGSYCTDSSLIGQDLGWKPAVRFTDGIARTLAYFRNEVTHYLDLSAGAPRCRLEAASPGIQTAAVSEPIRLPRPVSLPDAIAAPK